MVKPPYVNTNTDKNAEKDTACHAIPANTDRVLANSNHNCSSEALQEC